MMHQIPPSAGYVAPVALVGTRPPNGNVSASGSGMPLGQFAWPEAINPAPVARALTASDWAGGGMPSIVHESPPIAASAGQALRVLVVDARQVVRAGLRQLLNGHSSIHVVGEAEDVAATMHAVETLRPDVVLLDVSLGSESGFDACSEIIRRSPQTKVVLFTGGDDAMCVAEALHVGARSYLLKGVPLDALVCAFDEVCAGKTGSDAAAGPHLNGAAATVGVSQAWPCVQYGLSRRELEVLQLMTHGLDNRHIARALFIGEETVKTHVKAVLRKLRARDRTHGVVIALRGQVVP